MSKAKNSKQKIVWAVLGLAAVGVAVQVHSASQLQVVQMPPTAAPVSTIVKFDQPSAKQAFLDQNHLKAADLKPIPKLNAYVVAIKPDQIVGGGQLATHPNLQYHALATPNDPIYPDQWWLGRVAAPTGWDITTGSSSVTVAVIDTGFALNHEDLASQWVENSGEEGLTIPGDRCWTGVPKDKKTNNCDDDSNGFADDWRGWDFEHNDNDVMVGTTAPTSQYASHGTMTAGLAGAAGNNGRGGAGVSWGTKILPIQALDDSGTGYTDSIAGAIHYAVERGAKVISLSLGSTAPDDFMRNEIIDAMARGVTVVAAAGNSDCACMVYPANYPEVIAVGATDQNDNRASFSSYGPNLDIMAPGLGSIRTTYWTSANQTSAYTSSAAGTSISTPIVAGAAALLYSRLPNATPDDIARFLITRADKVSGLGGAERNDQYGYGRLNVFKSLLGSSLGGSHGQLLNKSAVSLSAPTLAAGPLMNSTCYGPTGASCEIKLTSPDNNSLSLGSKSIDTWGGANFDWSASAFGLTVGHWKIESILSLGGQSVSQAAEYLDVSP